MLYEDHSLLTDVLSTKLTSAASFDQEASDLVLANLLDLYEQKKSPIRVDFRRLVDWVKYGERYTHFVHPYPAKLLVHIPHLFINSSYFSSPGDVVLDPFCGSGTVLLEALLSGRQAVGADSNPLARLISRVKTAPIDPNRLRRAVYRLASRVPAMSKDVQRDVVNLEYWFYPHVIKQLQRIVSAIDKTRDDVIRDFFSVAFSACVKRVSLSDPRLSVPVRLRADQYKNGHALRKKTQAHLMRLKKINVIDEFLKILDANVQRNNLLYNRIVQSQRSAAILCKDARNLIIDRNDGGRTFQIIDSNSVDMVVTSPPYIGAQKYIRASSLSLGWLGLCASDQLRNYEDLNIGREHYHKKDYIELSKSGLLEADKQIKMIRDKNPLRARIASQYLLEMREACVEMHRVLKGGGYIVLVVGNNHICGELFATQSYLEEIMVDLGFRVVLKVIDDIRSRGLMTKRNRTAGLIESEWVMVFKKDA